MQLRGTILEYDPASRSGKIEGPNGGLRFFFSLNGNGIVVRRGEEVLFDFVTRGGRREAINIAKVPRPEHWERNRE